MDFFKKKSKDIASQSSENGQPNPVTPNNTNLNLNEIISTENHKIEVHSKTKNQHFDKIYSKDGQVLFEGPYNISEHTQPELIDFEELIDLTLDPEETKTTLAHMNEFETVLNSLNNENLNNNNEGTELLDLDEINEFLNNTNHSDQNNKLEKNVKDNSIEIEIDICNENPVPINAGPSHLSNEITVQTQIVDISIDNNQNSNISEQKNTLKKSKDVLDTISISSSNEGYNSSDFEFISESEAKMDGFIINFSRNSSQEDENNVFLEDFDPGEGPSGLNDGVDRQNHVLPERDAYLDLFQGPYNPVLPWSDIIVLENKSIRPSAMNAQYAGMGFDKQLHRRCEPDSSEEEYADEANECIKKILFLYPGENRKRRRRRR